MAAGALLWDPETPRVTTGDDGTFAVAVPPGSRGHVLVKRPNNDYVTPLSSRLPGSLIRWNLVANCVTSE
jgi:hypothetical protein